MDLLKQGLMGGLDIVSGGLGRLVPEDSMARIPLLGPLMGAETDAQKALVKKQEQMALDAEKRRKHMERARLNAMAQKVLAFNPQNQLMSQMFGPDAAFTPQQMAQMVQNPMPPEQAWGTGTDAERVQQVKDRDAERKRQQMVQSGFQQPGPGPAPLQMPMPQAARRY
jgi:hypothetical protein